MRGKKYILMKNRVEWCTKTGRIRFGVIYVTVRFFFNLEDILDTQKVGFVQILFIIGIYSNVSSVINVTFHLTYLPQIPRLLLPNVSSAQILMLIQIAQ